MSVTVLWSVFEVLEDERDSDLWPELTAALRGDSALHALERSMSGCYAHWCVIAGSRRRHGQDKTVLSRPSFQFATVQSQTFWGLLKTWKYTASTHARTISFVLSVSAVWTKLETRQRHFCLVLIQYNISKLSCLVSSCVHPPTGTRQKDKTKLIVLPCLDPVSYLQLFRL